MIKGWIHNHYGVLYNIQLLKSRVAYAILKCSKGAIITRNRSLYWPFTLKTVQNTIAHGLWGVSPEKKHQQSLKCPKWNGFTWNSTRRYMEFHTEIHGIPWIYMEFYVDIHGIPWIYMYFYVDFHGFPCKYVDLYGVTWSSMCKYMWIHMAFHAVQFVYFHGVPWSYMYFYVELHGVPWNYMELHMDFHVSPCGFPWISIWISMEIQLYFDSPFSLQPLISAL